MKARRDLSADELASLYADLDRRLGGIGVDTQPGVAMRILDLTQNPDAGMQDYSDIIRNDPGLTGRLIRLSNSAFFAQRKPVTNIDRACVLLGLARMRSIALGFYLSKAASADKGAQISREVWGQSVYRACLAAEVARHVLPSCAPEAFIIGLMLDAGIPLAHKLLGPQFDLLYEQNLPASKSFDLEYNEHPFTHVDIMTTMLRRWKFPELLAKPIMWHHTPPPPAGESREPLRVLHRIAYYIGAVTLRSDNTPTTRSPAAAIGKMHLGLDSAKLEAIASRSSVECDAVLELFADVADPLEVSDLSSRVHQQLVNVLDDQMVDGLRDDSAIGPQQFLLGGLVVLIRPEQDGHGAAYSYDADGEPISSYRFTMSSESPSSIRASLGLEPDPTDDIDGMTEYLKMVAA
ncbi:MAG: HDOD domain-containing protein [Planctomycetota bacterium]|nr:MAG: HDOD domain-containing protein [Planctomycetota bacterium]